MIIASRVYGLPVPPPHIIRGILKQRIETYGNFIISDEDGNPIKDKHGNTVTRWRPVYTELIYE